MSQLTADVSRTYKIAPDVRTEQPVDASATIYGGSAVGRNSSTHLARQLVAADSFLGFADARAANVTRTDQPGLTINGVALGSAGAINVSCRTSGKIILALAAIAGATGAANVEANVYMSDGNTFTLSSTGNSKIGTIVNYMASTGNFEVFFQAADDHL